MNYIQNPFLPIFTIISLIIIQHDSASHLRAPKFNSWDNNA